ncbi:hypothetical protein [Nonomuraea typhae]|uniref:TipAS antibiotic-recognition domain-containing protein n=1 Tax=Nonomuraea typhae TaxID=2603600 RepID=A0ABW7ZD21_9ACTN
MRCPTSFPNWTTTTHRCSTRGRCPARPGTRRSCGWSSIAVDDGPGADARAQVRGWAEEYAAALAGSADPNAASWAEALEWFAKRTKGGQLSYLVHQDFVARFGIDPYAPAASSADRSDLR